MPFGSMLRDVPDDVPVYSVIEDDNPADRLELARGDQLIWLEPVGVRGLCGSRTWGQGVLGWWAGGGSSPWAARVAARLGGPRRIQAIPTATAPPASGPTR